MSALTNITHTEDINCKAERPLGIWEGLSLCVILHLRLRVKNADSPLWARESSMLLESLSFHSNPHLLCVV